MVDLAEIQAAYYMVAATGVLIAAVFYILNLRINQRNQELMLKAQQQTLETRQQQLFMTVYQNVTSKNFQEDVEQMHHIWEWKDLDDYLGKYGAIHPSENARMSSVFFTYDGIGVLVRRGMVDPELVYDLIYIQAVETWEKFKPLIHEIREKFKVPHVFGDYEFLYNKMISIRDQRGHKPTDLSGLDLSFQKKQSND